MNVKLANGLPFHPRTGQRALSVVRGLPVWALKGADGDDNDGSTDGKKAEGDDKDDAEADKAKGDKDKDKDKDTEGSDKQTPEQKRIAELEAQLAQRKTHLSEADKKREAAEKELQAIKDKDLSELERTKKELTTATASNEKLTEEINKLRMGNAFHNASGKAQIQWHNPAVALKTLDTSDVEVDKDGNVIGIEAAVKKLAKDHKYLVNTGKSTDDDEDDKKSKDGKRGPSGNGVGSGQNGGKGKAGELSKEDLAKRFPALNR